VLRVGVVGHRPARLLRSAGALGIGLPALEARLEDALERVLWSLRDDALALRNEAEAAYDPAPPLLRLVLGAAMGVDQLAARVAVERLRPRDPAGSWEVNMLLPSGRADFVLDALPDFDAAFPLLMEGERLDRLGAHWDAAFARADTITALPPAWRRREPWQPAIPIVAAPPLPGFGQRTPPPQPDHVADHTPAANFLLRQIDLLIAVWDGGPAMGPGGTPDIAARAHDAGLPVLRLDPASPQPVARLVTEVVRERAEADIRSWFARPLTLRQQAADATEGGVREALRPILLPPSPPLPGIPGERLRDERARLEAFLAERWPVRRERQVYACFAALLAGDAAAARKALRGVLRREALPQPHPSEAEWRAFIADEPDEGPLADRLREVLLRRYVAADLLAEAYGDLYRGLFVGMYGLSAAAVLVAIASLALAAGGMSLVLKLVLVLIECALLLMILLLHRSGRHRRVHERFLDYRALAEALRPMRALATFGEHAQPIAGEQAPGGWRSWYQAATTRELGLPHGHLDATYQTSLLRAVARHDVEPRIAEHYRTQAWLLRVERGLHSCGRWLFHGTLWPLALSAGIFGAAAATALPALLAASGAIKPWIGVWAAAAPTLGAALAAIRFTTDVEGQAVRAAERIVELEACRAELRRAAAAQDFDTTRDALLGIARVQAEDVEAFLALHGHKQLTLPG
jgi:hypothetical protein